MLRRLLAPLFVLCLAALALGESPKPSPKAPAIFRIGMGKRYHLATCPECKKKGAKVVAITPAQAQAGKLTPCSKCDPPPLSALAGASDTVKAAEPANPAKLANPAKPADSPPDPPKRTFSGRVVAVSDGDTLTVLDANKVEHKIRLEGIDAPEKGQAFGARAKQALSEKVFGKDVKVTWEKRDNYKRILGHIHVGERWINYELVADGMAWHYRHFNKDKRLADAELAARIQGVAC